MNGKFNKPESSQKKIIKLMCNDWENYLLIVLATFIGAFSAIWVSDMTIHKPKISRPPMEVIERQKQEPMKPSMALPPPSTPPVPLRSPIK